MKFFALGVAVNPKEKIQKQTIAEVSEEQYRQILYYMKFEKGIVHGFFADDTGSVQIVAIFRTGMTYESFNGFEGKLDGVFIVPPGGDEKSLHIQNDIEYDMAAGIQEDGSIVFLNLSDSKDVDELLTDITLGDPNTAVATDNEGKVTECPAVMIGIGKKGYFDDRFIDQSRKIRKIYYDEDNADMQKHDRLMKQWRTGSRYRRTVYNEKQYLLSLMRRDSDERYMAAIMTLDLINTQLPLSDDEDTDFSRIEKTINHYRIQNGQNDDFSEKLINRVIDNLMIEFKYGDDEIL